MTDEDLKKRLERIVNDDIVSTLHLSCRGPDDWVVELALRSSHPKKEFQVGWLWTGDAMKGPRQSLECALDEIEFYLDEERQKRHMKLLITNLDIK